MSVISSDGVFELTGACVHSLRFSFGAPIGYPQGVPVTEEAGGPPAFFRRIQVVSPPPTRAGKSWYSGMTLFDEPFRPDVPTGGDQLEAVEHDEGNPSLDTPDPASVVLDEWIRMDRLDEPRPVEALGENHGKYLLSIDYWNPGADGVKRFVRYYGEYRKDWTRVPEGRWVALTFDAFYPPERDSADILIPLGSCDSLCPA
ncbi:hypothetical protein C8E87_1045 [Paractinoplanes brasiliensis]|uniref:Uncharacterized protein n=2 Tax=Paractinoplanes brasiliensis TaxID=52695 RepID=A0A4V3C7F0_9ACTN|nr:hypothetical protein C8E87_1045 [Actinoplanes brasiliensis]GID29266.1 hypothetical protein Abr02nite_42490 [Actinoplanes brasiliensis]